MIKIIKKNDVNTEYFTLIAADNKSNCPDYFVKEAGQLNVNNTDKQYFLYLDNKAEILGSDLQKYFHNIFKKINVKNLQIDLHSFTNENINIYDVCQIIAESIYYVNHKPILFKLKVNEEFINKNYYFIAEINEIAKCVEIIKLAKIKLESVNLMRELQDLPPNKLNALTFVEKVKAELKSYRDLEIKVLDKTEIVKENMGLLLAVNQGSVIEPRVIMIKYNGDANSNDILGLIGKGITFDSGGYSLKPDPHMKNMKFDMSGAAAVCASMLAIAKLKPKKNVVAIACLTENVIGSKAILVDSIVQSMSGKWVEIADTDAEGRLVLADGITFAIKKAKATAIIDVATLTGAISRSLGPWYTGAMTNNNEFYQKFAQSAVKAKESIWEMPVNKYHQKIMSDVKIADLSNFPGELNAGMSTAAAFLFAFNENKPHIHLDIAGTAWVKNQGTGVMVKTLIEYINS